MFTNVNYSESICDEDIINDSFKAIIDSSDDLIWSVDENYALEFYNVSFKNHMKKNYNVNLAPGLTPYEMLPDDRADFWTNAYKEVPKKGRYKLFTITKNNDKYLEVYLNPIYKGGRLKAISVFAKDITKIVINKRRLEKLNAELEERIDERTKELQTTMKELEAFIYTVSHDLKSPIRAIEAYSRIMLEDYPIVNAEVADIIGNINNISLDMISLIRKLMKYSVATNKEIIKEQFNINELIHEAFEELTKPISRKINLTIDKEIPTIFADKLMIKHLLYNIISNAVKYTKIRDVALINIDHYLDNENIVICFKDNGIGFDHAYAEEIFHLFHRLNKQEEFKGSGIGLTTARNIVQKHGGKIWAEGKLDEGAKIYISIPYKQAMI